MKKKEIKLECPNCGNNGFLIKEKSWWDGRLENWDGETVMVLSNQETDGFDDPICEKCGKKLKGIDFEYEW